MKRDDIPENLRGLPGAYYVRVSSGDAKQDPDRQRKTCKEWATAHGLLPPAKYEDVEGRNPRYMPEKRKDFQRLLKDVRAGKVRWIVVDAADRWGTADYWERIEYLAALKRAGCQLWTVDNRHLTADNVLAHIEGVIDQETSDKELIEKARRVYGGKHKQASEGAWTGGKVIPYGVDIVCLGPDGKEKFRVVGGDNGQKIKRHLDGTEETYLKMPVKEKTDKYAPRPTIRKDRLKTLRMVFDLFANQAISYNHITKRLNDLNIPYPNSKDGHWRHFHVISILKNPLYVGKVARGKTVQARKLAIVGTDQTTVDKREINTRRTRPKEHWVLVDAFPPIVPVELFEKTQKKIEKLEKSPNYKRNPRDSEMFFAGLLVCAKCGRRMRAVKRPRHVEYCCSSYSDYKQNGAGNEKGCLRHTLNHEDVLHVVQEYLRAFTDKEVVLDRILNAPKERQDAALEGMRAELGDKVRTAHAAYRGMHGFMFEASMTSGTPLFRTGGRTNDPAYHKEVVAEYRKLYQAKRGIFETQLAAVQKEYDTLTQGVLRLPPQATRAIQQTRETLAALQERIDHLEGLLTDYSAKLDEISREIDAHMKQMEQTLAALGKESIGLAAAEMLHETIGEIRVHFEPTGLKYPTSRPVAFEIHSPFGDATMNVLSRGSF